MVNLSPLLSPESVALIGAATDTTILRGRTLKVMLSHAYSGRIYPVSRSHAEIQGRKAYPSIDAVPEKVDLAVLIIPAEFVPDELERCGLAGVKAALIITSGFAEQSGGQGAVLQNRLREIAKRFDMIVCGPNTEGFVNTALSLCPTFSPAVDGLAVPLVPKWCTKGHVAVIAQSGGIGFAFFDRGRPKEIPFSHIVTTGNEACLEVFEVVEYLLDEGGPEVFLLFIENIKTAETFRRAADKALKAGKPIIVVKVGHSDAGQRAAASHTAALAGSYEVYQAMFREYGIIEGADLEEMVDLAAAFSCYRERLPKSRRVGIGTASGGAGGWLADACAEKGLEIPELDSQTRALIDKHVPSYGTSQNPVDGTAQAIRQIGYSELARLIALSDRVDSVAMVISARSAETLEREHQNLQNVSANATKPIVMWSYTNPCAESIRILRESGYPLFTSLRHCARAIATMAEYRNCREGYLARSRSAFTPNPERQSCVRLALIPTILCEYQVAPLLREYGIPSTDSRLAKTADEAVEIAASMHGPVALKVQSPNLLHKTEAGGVTLNLRDATTVRSEYDRLLANARRHVPDDSIHGILVQRMASSGIEVIVGVRRDPVFGPMLMVGMGGVQVEVSRDFAMSSVPMTAADAIELLDQLRSKKIFDGIRGSKACDMPALVEVMVRVSEFAAEHQDEIQDLELNPVIVHEVGKGVSIVDGLLITRSVHQTLATH